MYAQSGEHIEIDGEANRERLIWEFYLYTYI